MSNGKIGDHSANRDLPTHGTMILNPAVYTLIFSLIFQLGAMTRNDFRVT